MKSFILIGIAYLVSSGCAGIYGFYPYDYPVNFDPSTVVLLEDANICEYKENLMPKDRLWSKGHPEAVKMEVMRLKAMSYRTGGNTISDVVIQNSNEPLGHAKSYRCPDLLFKKLQLEQKDEEYYRKVIKIVED